MASFEQTLTALRRYDSPSTGVFEEFAAERLGPGGALALLAGPIGARHAPAWVICPTIGFEHGNLRRLEAVVARALAAAGLPSLRIRPDAHPVHGEISLPVRLAEVEEAVALLRQEHDEVAAFGVLFGGTVAALQAERLGLSALAIVEPVVGGGRYARELLRREAVAHLLGDGDGAGDGARPLEQLERDGHVSIRGLRLTRDAYDQVSAVDLLADLRTFAGRSLVLGISPSGTPGPGLRKLGDRLQELKADVTLDAIADPLHAPLGDYYYRDAGLLRIDTRLELDQAVAERVAAWAREET